MSKEGTPADRFYSQAQLDELLAKAQQEAEARIAETDKRFKVLDDEVKNLRKVQKEAEKAEEARRKAIEAERKKAEEAQMSAKELLAKRQEEMAQQLQAVQEQQEQERALLKKELEFMQLQNHVQRRVAEESENIAPELIDFIGGNSVEEVEASIERVKAKTAQIMEGIQQAGIARRAQMPGVAPAAGTNGVTPMDQPADRQLSADDIKGMGMKEFAQLREKLGMGNANNQGLFR